MINTEISQQAEKILGPAPMPEISAETIVKALYRLPSECLPHILQYIEFLEYRFTHTSQDSSEDEALWDAVQAERGYRKQHPEDMIVCDTIEELRAALEDEK